MRHTARHALTAPRPSSHSCLSWGRPLQILHSCLSERGVRRDGQPTISTRDGGHWGRRGTPPHSSPPPPRPRARSTRRPAPSNSSPSPTAPAPGNAGDRGARGAGDLRPRAGSPLGAHPHAHRIRRAVLQRAVHALRRVVADDVLGRFDEPPPQRRVRLRRGLPLHRIQVRVRDGKPRPRSTGGPPA